MANPEHVEIVKQCALTILDWRENNPGIPLDLYQADLSDSSLSEANLSEANLCGANLSGSDLRDANFSDRKIGVLTHDSAVRVVGADSKSVGIELRGYDHFA